MGKLVKLKILLYASLIGIIGLVIFYLTIPISDTYLVSDVQEVQSSLDHRSRFLDTLEGNFADQAKDLNTETSGLRDQVVQIALSQVGTREQNGNTNIIKYNDWYAPLHPGFSGREEYCAIFTLWVFDQVGMYTTKSVGPPVIDSASVADLTRKYMKDGRFVFATSKYDPRPGDLIFYTQWVPTGDSVGHHSNHMGLVVDFDENYVYTVEGNTSIPAGEFQRAGNGVYSKKHARPKSGTSTRILGYGVPWYEGDPEFKAVNGIPS